MKLTLEADYAVRIAAFLACENERRDAKTISEKTGVSLRFALKILRKLALCEIVKSFKGKKGGYTIAKPAEEISIYDIVSNVDGEYYFSRCLVHGYECTQEGKFCGPKAVYNEITDYVIKKLSDTKLSDVI